MSAVVTVSVTGLNMNGGVGAFWEKPVDAMAQAETQVELYLKTDEQMQNLAPISFGAYSVIAPRDCHVFSIGGPLN